MCSYILENQSVRTRVDWTDSKFNGEPFKAWCWSRNISKNEKIIAQLNNYWLSNTELETSLFFLNVDDMLI